MGLNPVLKSVENTLSRWKRCLKLSGGMRLKKQERGRRWITAKNAEDQLVYPGGLNCLLPLELLEVILEQCDFATQIKVERVCQRWKSAGRKPYASFDHYKYVVLDLHALYPLDNKKHLQQLENCFSTRRSQHVESIAVRGSPWTPQEWDDLYPVCLDTTPRIPHPLFITIAQLVEEDKCPLLTTVILSGIRICITSSPELHQLHFFIPSTVRRLEFHNVNVVVAFLELPVLVIRPFHVRKFWADLDLEGSRSQRKQRLGTVLMDLTNQAIRENPETETALKRRAMSMIWTSSLRNVFDQSNICGVSWIDCRGRDLCKILAFRMNLGTNCEKFTAIRKLVQSTRQTETVSLKTLPSVTLYALQLYENYENDLENAKKSDYNGSFSRCFCKSEHCVANKPSRKAKSWHARLKLAFMVNNDIDLYNEDSDDFEDLI